MAIFNVSGNSTPVHVIFHCRRTIYAKQRFGIIRYFLHLNVAIYVCNSHFSVKLTGCKSTLDEKNSSINIWSRVLFICIHADTSISVNNPRLPCCVSTCEDRCQFHNLVCHHDRRSSKVLGSEFQSNWSSIGLVLLISVCTHYTRYLVNPPHYSGVKRSSDCLKLLTDIYFVYSTAYSDHHQLKHESPT